MRERVEEIYDRVAGEKGQEKVRVLVVVITVFDIVKSVC